MEGSSMSIAKKYIDISTPEGSRASIANDLQPGAVVASRFAA
jgi:hypothetical protein